MRKILKYKIDIIENLKKSGYNTNRILKEKLIGQSSMTKIRNGEVVGIKTIASLCELLDLQPGDILEYEKRKGQ